MKTKFYISIGFLSFYASTVMASFNYSGFNTPMPTFEQANPWITASRDMEQIRSQELANQAQVIHNQMLENQLALQRQEMEQQSLAQEQQVRQTREILVASPDKTYLGCINCAVYSPQSIFNPQGKFGSRFSDDSILNHHSLYGSRHSNLSACNAHATHPPFVFDNYGNFLGFLSLNLRISKLSRDSIVYKALKKKICG